MASVVVVVVSVAWGLQVLYVAAVSKPIIQQLELENGGPLDDYDWYVHPEAQAVFDREPNPGFDRFDPVDGSVLYIPQFYASVLTIALVLVAMRVGLSASGAGLSPRFRFGLIAACALCIALLVVPLFVYSETIEAVAAIVE